MKYQELNEVLRKHQLYLKDEEGGVRANLSEANLKGADLRVANLSSAVLISADLRKADLRKAYLSSADLWGADLRVANLSSADLRKAYLFKSVLSSADLSSADLGGADLTKANLSSADLRGADLTRANLSSADLSSADLRGVNLRGVDLTRANLRNTKHDYTILKIINELKYHIVLIDDLVTVGCRVYTYKEWKSFSNEEVSEMGSEALDFYKMLIPLLDYHYKGTKFEIKESI